MADKLPEIRPTPVKMPGLAAIASALRSADEFARKPFGYDNPPLQMLSDFLGVPEKYRTLENIAYGSPLTRGSGQARQMTQDTTGAVDLLFGAPAAGRLAVKAGKAAAPYAARQAVNLAEKYGVAPTMNVIKPKGGNWYEPSIDQAIEPLRARDRFGMTDPRDTAAALGIPIEEAQALHAENAPNYAINRWLDTKLRNYIKNELATPEDPVRALAERGVLHHDPAADLPQHLSAKLALRRTDRGYPAAGMGVSELARGYEKLADRALAESRASDWSHYPGEVEDGAMSWTKNVPPDTPIHEIADPGLTYSLGFNHLVDEMRNAMAIGTDIPPNLRIDPKKLEKMTVPQIVERVSQINAWRAEQAVIANIEKANNAATVLHKEYPEQGYKWVEIKAPEPKSMPSPNDREFIQWAGQEGYDFNEPGGLEAAMRGYAAREDTSLEEALKYEGDVTGHCVGDYCPDVAEGRSRIYSLRDKKGEPHVTIEVKPGSVNSHEVQMDPAYIEFSKSLICKSAAEKEAALQAYFEKNPPPSVIAQIKGKQNRMPKEEYLPFVQDFVRGGKWSDIRDNRNAGLRRLSDVFNYAETEKIRQLGGVLPQHGWLTGEDIQQLHNLITPEGKRFKYDAKGNIIDDGQNYAEGGLVQAYNPEEVDAIAKQFEEAMNG